MRTMGIEEEYLLLGPDGVPVASGGAALKALGPSRTRRLVRRDVDRPAVDGELTLQQLESGSRPRTTTHALLEEVRDGRGRAQEAAGSTGARIAAVGTAAAPVSPTTTPDPRYEDLIDRYALTAREQLTCGCHIHVGVQSDAEGVAVLDRIFPWLPVLLALSTNSPFWQGVDSGYASYRSQVWNRWPSAGPVSPFGTPEAYHRLVEELVATDTILDAGMVYFDARLSARYPTVEIRVADVCLDARDAVVVAGIARALVDTLAAEAAAGAPPSGTRVEVLRAATWRAGRSGLAGQLLSPRTMRPVPATEAVEELLDHLGPALERSGDAGLVTEGVARILADGTGADLQRRWFAEGGALRVAEEACDRTLR